VTDLDKQPIHIESSASDALVPVSRGPRLSDQVAEQLLKHILDRGLRPGDKLPSERELGELFKVSRTVIREATRALAARGVIEVRSGTGLSVAAVDASTVAETMNLFLRGTGEIPYDQIHEVRAMIEIEVAGLAAERRTYAEVADLRSLHEHMGDLLKRDEAITEVDVEFHRALARMTHNPLHLIMLDSIKDILLEIRREAWALRDEARKAHALHGAVLEAVAAQDVPAAREAMQRHLEQGIRVWRRLGKAVHRPSSTPVSST